MSGLENPEAKYSKEDNHSLEVLAKHIRAKKLEEDSRAKPGSRQEMIARNNAKMKVVRRHKSDRSTVTVIESKQVRNVENVSRNKQVITLKKVIVRREVPAKEFIGVGAWGF